MERDCEWMRGRGNDTALRVFPAPSHTTVDGRVLGGGLPFDEDVPHAGGPPRPVASDPRSEVGGKLVGPLPVSAQVGGWGWGWGFVYV